MTRLKCVALLSVALLSSCPVQGQEVRQNDPVAIMRAGAEQRSAWAAEWLGGNVAERVAWGAWLARQDRMVSLTPLLVAKVAAYDASASPDGEPLDVDRHDAMLAVLDALIEFKADVPVAEAKKLYPEFSGQAIILLIFSTDQTPWALDIFDKAQGNATWLAAGNVLAKTRPAGFAGRLLEKFTEHLSVSVLEPGWGGGGGIGGVSSCGAGVYGVKKDWPEIGVYWLTQFPERQTGGAVYLVGGEVPVFYVRATIGYINPRDGASYANDGDRDQYRAQYLNRMLEFSSRVGKLEAYPQASVEWSSEADFRKQLTALVADKQTQFMRAFAGIHNTGTDLTDEEAMSIKPRIEVLLRDERTSQSVPLPSPGQRVLGAELTQSFHQPLP